MSKHWRAGVSDQRDVETNPLFRSIILLHPFNAWQLPPPPAMPVSAIQPVPASPTPREMRTTSPLPAIAKVRTNLDKTGDRITSNWRDLRRSVSITLVIFGIHSSLWKSKIIEENTKEILHDSICILKNARLLPTRPVQWIVWYGIFFGKHRFFMHLTNSVRDKSHWSDWWNTGRITYLFDQDWTKETLLELIASYVYVYIHILCTFDTIFLISVSPVAHACDCHIWSSYR